MSHRNARLNFHGRLLLVQRVRVQGWAVAHAAKALGVSRQCAHRWVARFDAEGEAGLHDRSSRPHHMPDQDPRRSSSGRCCELRRRERRGQDWLGPELGLPPRTVSRILRRHEVPAAVRVRPDHRRGDPGLEDHRGPLRTRPSRGAGPRGREEDRQDPRRRRLEGPRPPDRARPAARRRPGSATTTSTRWSTTTPGWPTPRSSPTRRAPPAPASSPAPRPTSPPSASPASNE